MPVKNIVLDMGNVLLDYNPEVPLAAYVDTEENRRTIRRELFEGPEWVLRDLGEISEEEMFARVGRRIPGALHEMLRKCVYGWDICMTPVPGAREFCGTMKQKGYGLYVLSNASDNFYDYFFRFEEPGFFDGILISAEVHAVKPDASIYSMFLEKYRLKAAECLFIDDRADNVAGAVAAGMSAEQYEGNFEVIIKNRRLQQADGMQGKENDHHGKIIN